jgi:hypothetical protein
MISLNLLSMRSGVYILICPFFLWPKQGWSQELVEFKRPRIGEIIYFSRTKHEPSKYLKLLGRLESSADIGFDCTKPSDKVVRIWSLGDWVSTLRIIRYQNDGTALVDVRRSNGENNAAVMSIEEVANLKKSLDQVMAKPLVFMKDGPTKSSNGIDYFFERIEAGDYTWALRAADKSDETSYKQAVDLVELFGSKG